MKYPFECADKSKIATLFFTGYYKCVEVGENSSAFTEGKVYICAHLSGIGYHLVSNNFNLLPVMSVKSKFIRVGND